ncbi:DUF3313 domain-containing protein [bacterium AH-315-E10]|nr:DUF3313 domain-containing protein [bacterium AH-315-E10]
MLLTSCTSYEQPRSGFLSDYKKLVPGKINGSYVYYNSEKSLGSYKKLLIEPVKFYFHKEARGFYPHEMKRLSSHFHKQLLKKLGDDFEVVTQPGKDVLRIRIAITNIVPAKPALNYMSSIVTAVKGDKEPVITHFGASLASIEGEAIDSETQELIVAFISSRSGGKPVGQEIESLRWGQVRTYFDDWASLIKVRLTEAHGTD